MKSPSSVRRALSVVEALVAFAILSSSIIPIILFLSLGTESVKGTRDASGAAFVANRTFEELRSQPFDALVAGAKTQTLSNLELAGTSYRRTLAINPLAPDAGLRAALLWLKVEWTRDKGKTLSYEVGTVLSEVR